jgi:RNA polymerase sigma factor (sigma-70 family)
MRAMCDEAALDMVAWRDGDAAALDRLVRLLTPMLWHVVRAYRLDQASAEDVVQTTWLALVRHRDAVGDPQAVVRWLTVTARREAWRLAKAAQRVETTDDAVLDLRADGEEGPEATAVRRRRDEALWRAVAALPERCQRILRIVAFTERADYASLSTELGMPVGSIGPTRGRCLAKLRARLGAAGEWRTA